MAQIHYPFYEILCVDTGPQEISSSNFQKLNEWMQISADVLSGNYANLPPALSGVTISDYIKIERIPDEEYIPPYVTSVFIDIDRPDNILWRSSAESTERELYPDMDKIYALSDTQEQIVFIEELNEYRLIPPKIDLYTLSSLSEHGHVPGYGEKRGVGYGSPVIRNMEKPWPNNITALSIQLEKTLSSSTLSNLIVKEVLWQDEISKDFPHAFIRENGHWVPSAVWYEGKNPKIWDWMPLSAGYYDDEDMMQQFLYGKLPWLSSYSTNPLYNRNWPAISAMNAKNPVEPYPDNPTFEQPMFGTQLQLEVTTRYNFQSYYWPGVYINSGSNISSLLTQEVRHYYWSEGDSYDDAIYHEYFPQNGLPDGVKLSNTFTINWPNNFYVTSIVPNSDGPSVDKIPDNHAKYIIGREIEGWPYYEKTWARELSSSTIIPVKYNALNNNFPYPWFRFTSGFSVQNPPNINEGEYTTYRNILEGEYSYPWRAIPARNRAGDFRDWRYEALTESSTLLSNIAYVPWPYVGLDAWQGYDGFDIDRLKYFDTVYDDNTHEIVSVDVKVATFSAFSPEQYEWIGEEYDIGSYKFGTQLNGTLDLPCNIYRYQGNIDETDIRSTSPVSTSRFNPWSINANTIIGDHIKEITFYYPYNGELEVYDDPFLAAFSNKYLTNYLTKLPYPYWGTISSENENGEIEWDREVFLSALNNWAQPQDTYTKTNPDGTISAFYQPKGYDIFGTCLYLTETNINKLFLPNKMYAVVQIDTMPNRLTCETHAPERGQNGIFSNTEQLGLNSYNNFNQFISYGKFNEYYGEATDPNGENWVLQDPNPDYSPFFETTEPSPGYIIGNEELEFRLTNFFALFESTQDVSRIPTIADVDAGIAQPVTFKFKELLPHTTIRNNTNNYTEAESRLNITALASIAEDIAKNLELDLQIKEAVFGARYVEDEEDEDPDEEDSESSESEDN